MPTQSELLEEYARISLAQQAADEEFEKLAANVETRVSRSGFIITSQKPPRSHEELARLYGRVED